MFQYSNKSLFSRAREELKILFLAAALLATFSFMQPLQQLTLFILLAAMLYIAHFREFKSFLYLIPFLALADLGFIYFLQGTSVNLAQLVVVSNIRMFNLFMAGAFFSFSTDIFALMKLMKKLRFPEAIYLPTYVLFRFLPEIERDLLEIGGIQKLRGISPRHPAKYFKSIMLPLLFTLFQKSDELAIAYYLRKKQGRI